MGEKEKSEMTEKIDWQAYQDAVKAQIKSLEALLKTMPEGIEKSSLITRINEDQQIISIAQKHAKAQNSAY